ncbi:MAG: Rieske (2Fe-2S) protein, partial [Gammaproteobacteria bacterium]|nr:Rieske (2Fe-2S) protein [Gammaproteobacteria bacterium]
MSDEKWVNLGAIEPLKAQSLQEIMVGKIKLAVTFLNGSFNAVSGVCNHVGGPLGKGRLDGEYIVCPWHNWKFHCRTGLGEPGYEEDAVPRHDTKIVNGDLWVNMKPASKRMRKPHAPHPLARKVERNDGPVRLVGISTTAMDAANPRYSTSDALLEYAIQHAKDHLG